MTNLPGFVFGQSLTCDLGDLRGLDVFETPLASGLFTADEVERYRRTMIPIVAVDVDDHAQPTLAVLVDTSEPRLPVLFLSPIERGRLVPVCGALADFLDVFVSEPGQAPNETADDLAKRILRLMRRKKFAEVIEATNDLFSKYAIAIAAEDPMSGSPLRGRIGYCLNFRGLSMQELGELDGAIASFRLAADLCNDYDARINLAELLCQHQAAYDDARQLARQPLIGDGLWFRKVKVDAFASLMLGDEAQAERCYRLIHDKYAGLKRDYLESARSELESVQERPLAARILGWLGVVRVPTTSETAEARAWWEGLGPSWQKQLRILLNTESGADARDKAAKRKTPLTDDELAFVLSRKKVRLNKDYDVHTLEPLTALDGLEDFSANYWKRDASFFAPLAMHSSLEAVSIKHNQVDDLSFVASHATLRVLDASANQIASLEPLAQCNALRKLNVEGNPVTRLDALADKRELRELDCSCRPLASLAPLEALGGLETLTCRFHCLESLSSLASLRSLLELDINGCRPAGEGDTTLFSTRLDHAVIATLATLEKLTLSFNPGYEALEKLAPTDGDDSAAFRGLVALRRLKLVHALLPDLAAVGDLPNLERLDIDRVWLKNPSIAPLLACTKLRELTLAGERYDDFEQLAEHSELRWIMVRKGAVSDAALRHLAKKRPDITVRT